MYNDHTPMPIESGGILPCRFRTIQFVDASDLLNALKARSLRKEAKEVEDWIDRHNLGQPHLALLNFHDDSSVSANAYDIVIQLIGKAYINVDWT